MKALFAALFALAVLGGPALATDLYFSLASDKSIHLERYIDASIDDVWKAWTTSEGLSAVLETPCTVELHPGGKFEVLFKPDAPAGQRGSEGCTVLSFLDHRMLSFSWNAPPTIPEVRDSVYKTFVVVELLPAGAARTRVTLTHQGWPGLVQTTPQWDEAFAYFQKAWPKVLDALQDHLARHLDAVNPPSARALDPKNGYLYTFVALKRPDLLDTMTEEEGKQFGEHAAHIQKLTQEGTVVFAGPCQDFKGPAVVILDVRTEEEARKLMESDPAVKHGLLKAELHPVRMAFVRWRD